MKAILTNLISVSVLAAAFLTQMPALLNLSLVLMWVYVVFLILGSLMILAACAVITHDPTPSHRAKNIKSAGDLLATFEKQRPGKHFNRVIIVAMIGLTAAVGFTGAAITFACAWLFLSKPCLAISKGMLTKFLEEQNAL